jgi:hypothetical protein
MLLVVSCLNMSYINTVHIGVHHCSYDARICVVICQCCLDYGLVCFIFTPFDFFMEQSYCLELVVVILHTVYFCFLVWFSLSTLRVSASGFIICQIAIPHSHCSENLKNKLKDKFVGK